jgi:hypothetical protein
VIDRDAYCREIEAHLCRKNDGHLIRITGPAFERVMSWADQGVPLKVAQTGIDRYFERYYRKGPRRRPVRVEFCDADVLDAFDEWRRAVGVSIVVPDAEGGPSVEEPGPAPGKPRRSLRAHLDGVMARLTVLRGSDKLRGVADEALDSAIRALEPLRQRAEHARGDDRQAVLDTVATVGADLLSALSAALPETERAAFAADARRELEPFRERMPDEAYRHATEAAVARVVRHHYGLPDFTY